MIELIHLVIIFVTGINVGLTAINIYIMRQNRINRRKMIADACITVAATELTRDLIKTVIQKNI